MTDMNLFILPSLTLLHLLLSIPHHCQAHEKGINASFLLQQIVFLCFCITNIDA